MKSSAGSDNRGKSVLDSASEQKAELPKLQRPQQGAVESASAPVTGTNDSMQSSPEKPVQSAPVQTEPNPAVSTQPHTVSSHEAAPESPAAVQTSSLPQNLPENMTIPSADEEPADNTQNMNKSLVYTMNQRENSGDDIDTGSAESVSSGNDNGNDLSDIISQAEKIISSAQPRSSSGTGRGRKQSKRRGSENKLIQDIFSVLDQNQEQENQEESDSNNGNNENNPPPVLPDSQRGST